MKYLYRLLCLALITCILGACGGGGKTACSVAVGGLACSGGNSNGGGGASIPTFTYNLFHSMDNSAGEGVNPQAPLVELNGIFYGTTLAGGTANLGTVFKMDASTGQVTTIHSFVGGNTDGAIPYSGLVIGSDGNLYGTTTNGGPAEYGTVFKVAFTNSIPTVEIAYFFAGTNSDGANPVGGLIQGSDNAFYGTTSNGGSNNLGTVYKITLLGGLVAENPIYHFTGVPVGEHPQSGLIKDSAGMMYGTTSGGFSGVGTLYSIRTNGTIGFSKQFLTSDGATPYGPLLLGSDGKLYGTTSAGGQNGLGVTFSISTAGDSYNYTSFAGTTSDGSTPNGNLIEINNKIYGTTLSGGTYAAGTIFSVTHAGTETMVYAFGKLTDGANPTAGMVLAADGYYYGTTSTGGTNGLGTVYKFYP